MGTAELPSGFLFCFVFFGVFPASGLGLFTGLYSLWLWVLSASTHPASPQAAAYGDAG